MITYHEIEGENSFDFRGVEHTISDGINIININLTDGTRLNGWYKIKTVHQQKALKELSRRAVLKNKLPFSIAKSILKPANFKENQQLKADLKGVK